MKPKEPLIINLNVDMRVLAVIGITVCILALAFSAVRAQGSDLPNANDVQEMPPMNPPEQDPGRLELQCDDGLLPTANEECVSPDTLGIAPESSLGEVGLSALSGAGRHFYLTNASYTPNAALTACASGYHMASLWEILDVSNLTYDYGHPAAYTKPDSGYGPPSNWYGWVRTGGSSSNSSVAGSGNCLNWSSNSGIDFGVAVRLSNTWETAPGDISTWDANSFTCTTTAPVWCVGNFNTIFLPLIMK